MKQFTDEDVEEGSHGFLRIYIGEFRDELIFAPTGWQKHGLVETSTGYGRKLNTGYKIRFNGRLYRVYSTCFGNSGSCWFQTKSRGRIYVS